MPDNVSRPDSILSLTGFPASVKNVPANWPQGPAPNKVSLLWRYNFNDIYHKFSPYTEGENPFGIIPNKQPFIYRYIDEAQTSKFNEMDPKVKTLASSVNLTQDTVDDVVRVSKWLLTGKGVQWNVKQLILQKANAFDETGIYNPLSPVVATLSPLTLGAVRPMRHLEGGVFGLLTSTLGISSAAMQYPPPNSTAGTAALGRETSNDGKGLIRGRTATTAYNDLNSLWPAASAGGGVFGSTLGGAILAAGASFAVGLFGTTPKQPKGTIVRADEATYTAMASNAGSYGRLSYTGLGLSNVPSWGFTHAPAKVTINQPKPTKNLFDSITSVSSQVMSYIRNPLSIAGDALSSLFGGGRGIARWPRAIWAPIPFPDQTRHEHMYQVLRGTGLIGRPINGKETGFDYPDDARYQDIIFSAPPGEFKNSRMLTEYADWILESQQWPAKFTDRSSFRAIDLNDNLKRVIDKVNKTGTYKIDPLQSSKIISSGQNNEASWDRYKDIVSEPGRTITRGTVADSYRLDANRFTTTTPRTVDKSIKSEDSSLRMATSFTSDGINLLSVLGKDRKTKTGDSVMDQNLKNEYATWDVYYPYQDDLIAFFFYDVVNEKYIPFRATVKGISEGNTAFWDELRFIGRADQLYSYNGYSRTLSFTFNVVINSVNELLPTWKKINYLASSVKPSNYTKSDKAGGRYSNFLVPPMFMITIGDLYKYQPVVITSLNVNIPDDAAWETLSEFSTARGWSALNGMITAPNLGKNFAQIPKEAEISVTCNILEKERAQVGGCHFGHAPQKDDPAEFANGGRFVTGEAPYLPDITTFHRGLVEVIETGGVSTSATSPAAGGGVTPAVPATTAVSNAVNSAQNAAGNATGAVNSVASRATSLPTQAGKVAGSTGQYVPNLITNTNAPPVTVSSPLRR